MVSITSLTSLKPNTPTPVTEDTRITPTAQRLTLTKQQQITTGRATVCCAEVLVPMPSNQPVIRGRLQAGRRDVHQNEINLCKSKAIRLNSCNCRNGSSINFTFSGENISLVNKSGLFSKNKTGLPFR